MNARSLGGCRVLIVEDETILAMLLKDMLRELGCDVVATATQPSQAIAAIQALEIDVAILDINLGGQQSYGIAAELAARNLPFVFSTGYSRSVSGKEHPDKPVLRKPFQVEDLQAALSQALNG